jgi:serine O-acetyltransferase
VTRRRGSDAKTQDLWKGIRAQHPPFFRAVLEDAKITCRYRSEPHEFRTRTDATVQALRLMWVSDAFFGLVLYRAKARLQALGVPILPRLAHRLAMATAQICIGDPVVVQPGVYVAHGQIVVDGIVSIQPGVIIFPWVTIGLRAGNFQGPTIGRDVHIGTGAKVLGPISVGDGAKVGANAVVVGDVAPDATVVGSPARPVSQ